MKGTWRHMTTRTTIQRMTEEPSNGDLLAAGLDGDAEMIDLRTSPVDGPEADLDSRTNSELMVTGFTKLSESCKDLLYLLATKVPYRDISVRLGIAVGTIGPARKRCLKVLKSFDEVKQAREPAS